MAATELVRIGTTESIFRSVNERIAESAQRFDSEIAEFVCECDDRSCTERVETPLEEYERVRAQDDRFAVKPGHETLELEQAVDWTDDYVIVDKVPAAEPMVEDDPRGAPSS